MINYCNSCHIKIQQPNQLLCQECFESLPFIINRCNLCGINTDTPIEICGNCQRQKPIIDKAFSIFSFQPPISQFIHQYKQGSTHFQHFFKPLLLSSYLHHFEHLAVDGVAAVPSNAYKTLHRGFVPALPFAQYFESSLGITDYSSCLHKKLFSFHQKNKNRIRRLSSDPFWISDFNKASKAGHQQHPPKHMLLLDDVITTGASINQLAKHLKKQGVKKVFALSVAHTPRYL